MLEESRQILFAALTKVPEGADAEAKKLLEEIVARDMPAVEAEIEKIVELEKSAGTLQPGAPVRPHCAQCKAVPFIPMLDEVIIGRFKFGVLSCHKCHAVISSGIIGEVRMPTEKRMISGPDDFPFPPPPGGTHVR